MEKDYGIGTYYIVGLFNCNANKISKIEDTQPILEEAVIRSGATKINSFYHQFEPQGVSATVLIMESHFSLHTWPEKNYAAFDIFTCGKMDASLAIEIVKNGFEADRVICKEIKIGP